MTQDQSVPILWLLSDERNDAVLEQAIDRLPQGSGFVFRHYHLPLAEREQRFRGLLPRLHDQGHWVILSAKPELAKEWGAIGTYGPRKRMPPAGMKWIATAHDEHEILEANEGAANAIMLSPVFPTRSHPGRGTLGPEEFRRLAGIAYEPVIALGGMNAERAKEINWPRWAAIDGLS